MLTTTTRQTWLLALLSLAFGSCASVLNNQSEPVMLRTDPGAADVFDESNNKLGTTPFDVRPVASSSKTLRLVKEGYDEITVSITRTPRKDLMFLDAVMLCIPCPLDAKSGSWYSVNAFSDVIRLRKKIQDHDKPVLVCIDKVVVEPGDEDVVGRINNREKKFGDKGIHSIVGYADNLDRVVVDAMQDSYLSASRLSTWDNDKSGFMRPRIILKPVIRRFDFNLKGKTLRNYAGACSVECNWDVYDISDTRKPLESLTVKTHTMRLGNSFDQVLDILMRESVKDLLGVDSLYGMLQRAEKRYLAETKGDVYKIKGPQKSRPVDSKEALKRAVKCVVTVENKDGFGSGVIISNDGYILTNYHVVGDEKNIGISLNQGIKMKADVVKTNKDYDLALLKIPAMDLDALVLGDSQKAEIGDDVWAIGTPLEKSLGQTITRGIISGFRELNGVNLIQSDVSINPGNSGGPLINEAGEVIGITSMKIMVRGVEGIGFCIPSNVVLEMLNLEIE